MIASEWIRSRAIEAILAGTCMKFCKKLAWIQKIAENSLNPDFRMVAKGSIE